ncbi:MAG: Mth938-like domain-containing protein [Methylophilus sp.]|nr:Mth938-like domain-containing protein [Methylophilus sp.]MDP3607759.1 Mth938-like domain-containing protein [Methylophilus sp.]
MKLHLTTAEKQNLITGYGEVFIEINRQRYFTNTIVMPDRISDEWSNIKLNTLEPTHFSILADSKPEVVLLGTGTTHQFIHPKLYQSLTALGIPLECMTTAAACRTYNILMSEGRSVAAALFLL